MHAQPQLHTAFTVGSPQGNQAKNNLQNGRNYRKCMYPYWKENVKLAIVANVVFLNTNNSEGKGERQPSRAHTLKQRDSAFLNSH